jgi:hypothetical protein
MHRDRLSYDEAHDEAHDEAEAMTEINWTELGVFIVLFLIVAVMGFVAARWRRPASMEHLDEWGLGGRNFGGWVTWFLIGGDLYTAYTFVSSASGVPCSTPPTPSSRRPSAAACCSPPAASSSTSPSRSVRRSRCSCIRTR